MAQPRRHVGLKRRQPKTVDLVRPSRACQTAALTMAPPHFKASRREMFVNMNSLVMPLRFDSSIVNRREGHCRYNGDAASTPLLVSKGIVTRSLHGAVSETRNNFCLGLELNKY